MPLTSLARALADIKSEKFACHPAMFKTPERQEYMYFSQAVLINPTNRLISKKGTFKDFANDGYIKFQEIAEYQDFTFALVKGRSFTKVLDKQIALYLDKNNIFPMSNTDLSPIFQMIELGRVDATIAYQFELEHYIKEYSQLPTTFDVHQLVGLSTYSSGHIACPKNEWGRKLIAKIDAVLDQIKPTEAYKYALTYWWPHERNNPEFVQYYRTEFIHH